MIKGLFSGNKYKYRKFEYQPMYYDERKERLNKKIKEAETKGEDSPESVELRKEMLRSKMSSTWNNTKTDQGFFQTNKRSILIAGILLIAAYWILFRWDIAGFLEKYF
ncbi:MAG: hypothetical protein KDC84_12230 [Crocinitomicaceae bacterium]|nr:hypothetical protein [Crocinitomicaceae bacterium]